MSDNIGVKVMILDREYQVACPEEDQEGLLNAARYLDNQMRSMRNRGQSMGVDKLAVVTALNITHEMLSLKPIQSSLEQLRGQLTELSHDVDSALIEK